MVAKISIGSSLYGALAYNGEKINEGKGKLLATNKIFDGGTGGTDIHRAMEDFKRYMPPLMRTEKPVIHISLNPHPDDRLTDVEMAEIAREYMDKLGYGNQPYMVYRHEDIDRHHLHIVSIRVNENGKCLNNAYNFHRSKAITRELEQKYGLQPAERKQGIGNEPIRKVRVEEGDIKKQVGNVVKTLATRYRFQSMGEYRALLSIYNVTAEEARGEVRGREYHGIVYSATDDAGNKVGNPFKSSRFGKSVGYEALEKRFAVSKQQIKEKNLAEFTSKSVLAVMKRTYDRGVFTAMLKDKGIDIVFRETETGRIYGATFIDHRTGYVLNGSRMGKEFSANALQEHFTLPYAGEKPISLTIPVEQETEDRPVAGDSYEELSGGLGLLSGDSLGSDAQETAFMNEMQRKRKKKRKRRI
ncbi:conjugal transfer protein MobB [Bacteroides graminisolvens]|uniref:conjugal transfer protein MobB n=1 Tax=Bacteroides graminisolvens TaxID=477666 RepID=UPI002408F28F|nr:conjugal transfer protein MobB [Bacteroides graminisolvens]